MVHKHNQRRLASNKKDKILERDCWICAYCDGDATVVDHVVPWSWSHCDDDYNLVASCERCNAVAGNMVFPDLTKKRVYLRKKIRGVRAKPPQSKIFYCIQCGAIFVPLRGGATNFLCGECNHEQEVQDREVRSDGIRPRTMPAPLRSSAPSGRV